MQLQLLERKIAGIVTAVEEGRYSRVLGDRLSELESQQEQLRLRLSESPTSVRLHPRLADIYANKVRELERSLNDPAIRGEAAEVLRSLVDRIELNPRKEGEGVDATLHGDLAEILSFCAQPDRKDQPPKAKTSGGPLSVVAGTRSHLYRTRFHYEQTRK